MGGHRTRRLGPRDRAYGGCSLLAWKFTSGALTAHLESGHVDRRPMPRPPRAPDGGGRRKSSLRRCPLSPAFVRAPASIPSECGDAQSEGFPSHRIRRVPPPPGLHPRLRELPWRSFVAGAESTPNLGTARGRDRLFLPVAIRLEGLGPGLRHGARRRRAGAPTRAATFGEGSRSVVAGPAARGLRSTRARSSRRAARDRTLDPGAARVDRRRYRDPRLRRSG
jgi:hypothetical protein